MTTHAVGMTARSATSAAAGVAAGELKFESNDEFHRELRRRVDEYFRTTGLRPRHDLRMFRKSVVALTWLVASYLLLVFAAADQWQATVYGISLGAAAACVGFNVMHDGVHRSYSERRWVNTLAGLTLDLLGGSSYFWEVKHNIVHHTYANITGYDDDIDIGILGRLSPHQTWLPFHKFQHWYIWPFYGLVAFKWFFYDDFSVALRGRIGEYRVARPRGWDLAVFVGVKVLFVCMAFGIPLLYHPVSAVVLGFLWVFLVEGVVTSVVFQLAHCVEEAAFPMPNRETGRMDNRWAAHQVETTVDYARANPFVTWFVGGLNYQIEHHLLPHISHVHYPALAELVAATCRDFGLRYMARRTFSAAVVAHFRWLRRMAQPTES